jgi:hypothetical protein
VQEISVFLFPPEKLTQYVELPENLIMRPLNRQDFAKGAPHSFLASLCHQLVSRLQFEKMDLHVKLIFAFRLSGHAELLAELTEVGPLSEVRCFCDTNCDL